MPISSLNAGSSINIYYGNVLVESTIDVPDLLAKSAVIGDSNFNAESKWSKVVVKYEHANGQVIVFPHIKDGASWKASGVFLDECNLGNWEKKIVVLADHMNDTLTLSRNDIGSGEDVEVVSHL